MLIVKWYLYIYILQISSTPDNGAYIYGLYIEGCRFDINKGLLED